MILTKKYGKIPPPKPKIIINSWSYLSILRSDKQDKL